MKKELAVILSMAIIFSQPVMAEEITNFEPHTEETREVLEQDSSETTLQSSMDEQQNETLKTEIMQE